MGALVNMNFSTDGLEVDTSEIEDKWYGLYTHL